MKACLLRFVLAALFVGTTLSACSTDPPAATAVPSAHSCQSISHVVCVIRGDNGHDIRVHIAQMLTVDFEESGLDWSGLRQVGPQLLVEDGPVRHDATSFTVSYRARARGQTALLATGTPKCSRNRACPQFIVLWRVEITVVS